MKKKRCSKCKRTKDVTDFALAAQIKGGRDGHCKSCKREYGKRYRATKAGIEARRRSAAHHGKQIKARLVLQAGVKNGSIKKHPCFLCGSTKKIEGHHIDYSFPKKVVWLCVPHHHAVHTK